MTRIRTPLKRSEAAELAYFKAIELTAEEVFDGLGRVFQNEFDTPEIYAATIGVIFDYVMASDYETALEFLGALTVLAQPIDEEPYLKVYGFACLDEEGMFCFLHKFCEVADMYYGVMDDEDEL